MNQDRVISSLRALGNSDSTIAAITGLPLVEVVNYIDEVTPQQVSDTTNFLTQAVLLKSLEILEIGHPDQQALVLRTVLSAATRQFIHEDNTNQLEVASALERIFAAQRAPYAIESNSTPTRVDDLGQGSSIDSSGYGIEE